MFESFPSSAQVTTRCTQRTYHYSVNGFWRFGSITVISIRWESISILQWLSITHAHDHVEQKNSKAWHDLANWMPLLFVSHPRALNCVLVFSNLFNTESFASSSPSSSSSSSIWCKVKEYQQVNICPFKSIALEHFWIPWYSFHGTLNCERCYLRIILFIFIFLVLSSVPPLTVRNTLESIESWKQWFASLCQLVWSQAFLVFQSFCADSIGIFF